MPQEFLGLVMILLVIALAAAIAWWLSLRRADKRSAEAKASAQRPQVVEQRVHESALPLLNESLDYDDDFEITLMGDLRPEFVELLDGAGSSAEILEIVEGEEDSFIDIEIAEDEEPLILVTGYARTDRGLKRPANEDAFLIVEELSLFLVADGMGGYAGGDVASEMAVEVIERAFRRRSFEGDADPSIAKEADELIRAVHMAHRAVYDLARKEPKFRDMGTTVVAARFSTLNRVVHIAHVGDSRCYRVREGKLKALTRDHTMGVLFGVEGKGGRKLAQAVGVRDEVIVDLNTDYPMVGDLYLICSDGLTKMVDDETILRFALEGEELEGKATRLIDEANERGGRDNITVIVIRVDSPEVKVVAP